MKEVLKFMLGLVYMVLIAILVGALFGVCALSYRVVLNLAP